MPDQTADSSAGAQATLVYKLYLAALVVGITAPVGVVMAYVNRENAPEWLHSHYTFQVHTFWKGVLIGFIGVLLLPSGIGIVVLLLGLVWVAVRCFRGLSRVAGGRTHPYPDTWMLG